MPCVSVNAGLFSILHRHNCRALIHFATHRYPQLFAYASTNDPLGHLIIKEDFAYSNAPYSIFVTDAGIEISISCVQA